MSWDVILMYTPADITSIDDLSSDFVSELGPHSTVLDILAQTLPEIDLKDPAWGFLDGDGFYIEFNIGRDDPVQTVALHVRGGDGALEIIHKICQNTGWRALDTTLGDFINFESNPAQGLQQWRSSRDHVVESLQAEGQKVVTGKTFDLMAAPPKKKKWWQFWK